MSPAEDHIQVSTDDVVAYARVIGRGSFKVSGSLKEFGDKIFGHGRSELVVDLRQCVGMDSTFMGVLAGLAFRCKKEQRGKIVLVNLSEKSLKLISTLGLNHLVEYHPIGKLPVAYVTKLCLDDELAEIDPDCLSADERARMMLASHENLAELSAENRERFKDVLTYLREEVEGKG